MTAMGLGLGLETSRAALRAAQLGLGVVAQNIAGANQDGYVRRRVDDVSIGPAAGVGRLWSSVRAGGSGGVESSVNRLADVVLDQRARVELSAQATAQGVATTLGGVEQVFDEPSDAGLASGLDDLWNSFADLANGADGTVVLSAAARVTDWLHRASTALTDQAGDATARLHATVDTASGLAATLGTVNAAIAAASASGQQVPDLLDQRDLITGQLATSIGATATLAPDGSATVTVGDTALVTGSEVHALAVGADDASVTVGGAPTGLTAGSAAADVAALTTTYPTYRARLDAVAASLRDTVNTSLISGYTASGAPGTALFTGSGAADLEVTVTDPATLAVAASPGSSDTDVAQQLSQAGLRADGPDARYRALVAAVGSDSARAATAAAAATTAAGVVVAARQSSESVSTDEELSSMLAYQRSYQAASRVLTTVDEMLDQLINHTGRVGI